MRQPITLQPRTLGPYLPSRALGLPDLDALPLASRTWHRAPPPPLPGQGFAATELADGSVLLCGGRELTLHGVAVSSVSAVWDPLQGWMGLPPLPLGRCNHVLAALPDGGALAVGGRIALPTGGSVAASQHTERWDPISGRWLLVAPCPLESHRVAAVACAGGRVLVVDLRPGSRGAASWYLPDADAWVQAPALGLSASRVQLVDLGVDGVLCLNPDPGARRPSTALRLDAYAKQWEQVEALAGTAWIAAAPLAEGGANLVALDLGELAFATWQPDEPSPRTSPMRLRVSTEARPPWVCPQPDGSLYVLARSWAAPDTPVAAAAQPDQGLLVQLPPPAPAWSTGDLQLMPRPEGGALLLAGDEAWELR